MVKFSYKGVDSAQHKTSGNIEAADRKSAIMLLRGKGISVVSINEAKAGGGSFSFGFKKSSSKIALNFLQKFLQLHSGGLAIGDAIRIMRSRLKDPQEQVLAESIHKDVCEGATIAAAMRKFPDIFNENTVCMVEAGERTGNLVPVISNLIEFLETKENIKKKFVSGMAYPATVCVIGGAVGAIFLIFVMPRLQKMLTSLGGELPKITQLLIQTSNFAGKYWWAILAACVFVLMGFFAYRNTPHGKYNIDKWSLKIPLIGLIIKENFYCQTANLLGTLLGSGINTAEAMSLAQNSSANLYFREHFIESRKLVMDGVSVTQAFEMHGIMPDLALDLLSVGENTGDLAKSFKDIASLYKTSLLEHLGLMTTMVTAIAMGVAIVGVAVLALSVISSVLKLTTSIKL